MTRARNQQVSLDDTPYYHCISRCVRRAFLFGDDPETGASFDHRKVWLVDRMKQLSGIFAIEICAYAVMSNHYHVVLHVNQASAAAWSDDEVVARWKRLFSRNALGSKAVDAGGDDKAARDNRAQLILQWRSRLADISWFMRCLNETIARRANLEDECSGRFWEGRFKSQALLDEKALITCMAYVDLNPVRAGISQTLQDSDFTSMQERLVGHARRVKSKTPEQKALLRHFRFTMERERDDRFATIRLAGFQVQGRAAGEEHCRLPFSQQDYFDLVSFSAGQISGRRQQSGANLAGDARRILDRIGMQISGWITATTEFQKHFSLAAGAPEALRRFQAKRARSRIVKFPRKWIRGIRPAAQLYGT